MTYYIKSNRDYETFIDLVDSPTGLIKREVISSKVINGLAEVPSWYPIDLLNDVVEVKS